MPHSNQIFILLAVKLIAQKRHVCICDFHLQFSPTLQTNKMENVTMKNFLKLLEWFIFLLMIISASLFVYNSFENYQSNATGIQVLSKKVQSYESPAMTICFQPYRKSSILQEYELDHSLIQETKENISWPVVFEKMSYKIGRDFNLTIALDFLDFYSKQEVIEINELILTEKASKLIEFEKIITLIAGICYSITPKNEIGKRQYNLFQIQFQDSLPSEDIPNKIEIIFTSKCNSYGVITNIWKEGQEFSFLIDPEKKDTNSVNLRLSQHHQLEITSGCTNDDFYYNCISTRLVITIVLHY